MPTASSGALAAVAIATPHDRPVWWTFRAPGGSVASASARLYVDAREGVARVLGVAPQDLALLSVGEERP